MEARRKYVDTIYCILQYGKKLTILTDVDNLSKFYLSFLACENLKVLYLHGHP